MLKVDDDDDVERNVREEKRKEEKRREEKRRGRTPMKCFQ